MGAKTNSKEINEMVIKQAVILCGGLGTRLKPITDTIPKPMVPILGKPFLEYLIEQLKHNGIFEILLLTGYKKEIIEAYFGDGKKYGVKIAYSRGPAAWDTGKRLYEAREMLDDYFFLMYSDNFVQYNLKKLINFYQAKNKLVSFVVYHKTKDNNISIDDQNIVLEYDKTRKAEHLNYVELGCMIVNSSITTFLDGRNFSFSDILGKLAQQRELAAFITEIPYYSISDPLRLALMEKYLAPKKIIILDRDGVINKKALSGQYVTSWKEFEFIPGVLKGLEQLSQQGYQFVIITNQAGIARGKYTVEDLEVIHQKMLSVFKEHQIQILKIYVCPHHWDEKCNCRKPNPGLLIEASREFNFRLDQSYLLGDDERDILAADNANTKSILIGRHYDKKRLHEYGCHPNYYAHDFKDAIAYILSDVK